MKKAKAKVQKKSWGGMLDSIMPPKFATAVVPPAVQAQQLKKGGMTKKGKKC